MKKIVAILLVIPLVAFGATESITVDSKTGKVKQTSTGGVGAAGKPFDWNDVSVTGIGGGGGGTPGGNAGQMQYKQTSAAFGGVPSLTFDGATSIVTVLGGNLFRIADPVDSTKKIQLVLSGINTGTTRNFIIPNSDFTGVIADTGSLNNFLTGIGPTGIIFKAQPTEANLSTSDITTNNVSTTKHGFAPKLPNDATKYLDGTGAYTVPPGGTGTPGGSDTQLQRNNAGAFGGISTLTSNGTVVTQKAGTNYLLVDPTDATKKDKFDVSNVATGTTRTTFVPNADNVLIVPSAAPSNQFMTGISGLGAPFYAQPSFANLSGSIGVLQQNIPVGKTLYVDSVNGNNSTALTNRFDRPYGTLNGAGGAVAAAGAGDEISVGPGTFNETGAVVLPQNVSFVGSGAGVTTIVTTNGVRPGTGDKISDMTIDARTGSNSSFSFALGADTTDTAFTDVTVAGVELLGNTDGFYFNKSGIDRVAIYDCSVSTTLDAMFMGNMTGSIVLYNNNFVSDGSIGGASITSGINIASGNADVYGGTIFTSNGVLEARGVRATGSGSNIGIHNVSINAVATTRYDLHQASSAVISNDGAIRPSGSNLTTSGTISQVVNTYEGNLGLTDITTANVSTTKHGFAPKLPNDATKYLDGTGAYSVPAGGGASIDDTAFASSWNGVTTIAPSKNAVYDWGHTFDTNDNGKVNVLDIGAGIVKTDSSGVVSVATSGTDYGNVAGPGSSQDNGIVRFDGTTGKLIQDSTATLSDVGTLAVTADASGSTDNAINPLDLQAIYNGGTPATGFGELVRFGMESTTTNNRDAAKIRVEWSDATDATRSAFMDFQLVNSASLASKMRLFPSGGLSLNNTTDPGAGIFNANTGFKLGGAEFPIAANGIVKRTAANTYSAATAKTDYWDTTDFVASGGSHAHGLVPDPGASAGTTKFLREDATWAVPAGGGGSPGGSNTQFQYNNSGAFGGVPLLTYDGSVLALSGNLNATIKQTINNDVSSNSISEVVAARANNSSAAGGTGLGAGIRFYAETSTTNDIEQGRIGTAWSDATHASRTAYMDFLLVNNAGAAASKMRLFPSGGLSVNNTTDPGAGIISANTGYTIGATEFPTASNGIVKRTAANTYAAAVVGTDYIDDDSDIKGFQALGSTIKAQTIGVTLSNVSGTFYTLPDNTAVYVAIYLNKAQTLTGVKWYQSANGSYTADNNNKVGLYSVSGGTLTKVAESTNDSALWSQGGSSIRNKAFSSTYAAAAGVYYVALLYNQSAQTTAPTIAQSVPPSSNIQVMDFTNGYKWCSTVAAQNDLPSTQAASGFAAASQNLQWVAVY